MEIGVVENGGSARRPGYCMRRAGADVKVGGLRGGCDEGGRGGVSGIKGVQGAKNRKPHERSSRMENQKGVPRNGKCRVGSLWVSGEGNKYGIVPEDKGLRGGESIPGGRVFFARRSAMED